MRCVLWFSAGEVRLLFSVILRTSHCPWTSKQSGFCLTALVVLPPSLGTAVASCLRHTAQRMGAKATSMEFGLNYSLPPSFSVSSEGLATYF